MKLDKLNGGTKMKELNIAVITEMGSHIITKIKVKEDHTMNQVVEEVRRLGYTQFRLVDTMRCYVKV